MTIWLGILELSTGRILASNAGHEFPILKDSSGRFSVLEDEHGFVVGGLENIEYVGYELTLEKGQTLFLYTDGVPEAMNENGEQFGLDRTLAALNRTPNARPSNLLMAVSKDVREFVGGAKQFDDITILCIRRKP